MYHWEVSKPKRKAPRKQKSGLTVFHPRIELDCSFDSFAPRLSEVTISMLRKRLKYEALLPVQAQPFSSLYKGRNAILHSRTGTGKTLAYALPLLERSLSEKTSNSANCLTPLMLIFVFSNELAVQTQEVLRGVYRKRLSVCVASFDALTQDTIVDVLIGTVPSMGHALCGGMDEQQEANVKPKVEGETEADTVVEAKSEIVPQHDSSTPAFNFSQLRSIIFDEVDATLGPRFSNAGRKVKYLLKHLRRSYAAECDGATPEWQFVVCGATIPNWVIKSPFLGTRKHYFRLVPAGSQKLPQTLECFKVNSESSDDARLATVTELLIGGPFRGKRAVVFVSPSCIDRLDEMLRSASQNADGSTDTKHRKRTRSGEVVARPLVVRSLSPAKDELDRIQSMQEFNSRVASVLISTDLGARGIDLVDVDVVLMTSVPTHRMAAEVFVHRAGRTARISKEGQCVLLVDPNSKTELAVLEMLESVTHMSFKPLALGTEGKDESIVFRLRVRGALGGASNVPPPREVLSERLKPDLLGQIASVKDIDATTIEFRVPVSLSPLIHKALWQYDLSEVHNSL